MGLQSNHLVLCTACQIPKVSAACATRTTNEIRTWRWTLFTRPVVNCGGGEWLHQSIVAAHDVYSSLNQFQRRQRRYYQHHPTESFFCEKIEIANRILFADAEEKSLFLSAPFSVPIDVKSSTWTQAERVRSGTPSDALCRSILCMLLSLSPLFYLLFLLD